MIKTKSRFLTGVLTWVYLTSVLSPAMAAPLSDISVESFEKREQPTNSSRNPFSPSSIEEIDPASLSLNGTILGPTGSLCLLSGRTLKEGDQIGRTVIKEIKPGKVTMKSIWGESLLKIKSYVEGTEKYGDKYEIYFEGATLKSALQFLSTAGQINLILPESMEGKVSFIYHQTDLLEAISSILRVNGYEYVQEGNIVRVGKADDIPVGADIQTAHFALNYAKADILSAALAPLLSEKGKIIADVRTNTLTAKDRPMMLEQIASVIQQMDQKDPQVHIEAKILDISSSFSHQLGIQWGFSRTTGNIQGFQSPRTGQFNVNVPANAPTSSMGILVGNLFNNVQLEAAITAAESKGDVRILSKPSVTTVNNTQARIRSGVTVYFKANSDVSISAAGGTDAEESDVQSIETGIELDVTPQITPDNMIKMRIIATESEADFSRTVDGIPSVIDNVAETTILIRDGETAVIGGLVKHKKSKQQRGVPALSYIPILGWLFKSKAVEKTDSELLIFLKTNIIRDDNPITPQPGSAYYEDKNMNFIPDKKEVNITTNPDGSTTTNINGSKKKNYDPDRKRQRKMRRD